MQTTSHFIGLKLKIGILSDLFVRLQTVLGDDFTALEFQNILSLYITLFYLPKELSSREINKIREILPNLSVSSLDSGLQGLEYFGNIDTQKLCCLIPNATQLTVWNALLRKTFPEYLHISDNSYPVFVPHITLFKIRNGDIFHLMCEALEFIIKEEIEKLSSVNIYESVGIFAVNSKFHPEIQVELL
ncbi:hypothetical protein AUK10_02385 [Candidatus Gracilibacteria bacterium CG2_30_37_12]|nr:MAG: hypothetical protein AUK10_02385 [Candidatus Gracilibacteria bacterium CG2_30_37_12]